MSCKTCNDNERIYYHPTMKQWFLYYKMGEDELKLPVKYCPNCGERLLVKTIKPKVQRRCCENCIHGEWRQEICIDCVDYNEFLLKQ